MFCKDRIDGRCRPATILAAFLGIPLAWAGSESHASAQSIAGINHYEVIVIGASMESHPENMAYEVSDCGLVVGRIHQNGRSEAFVFASRARFGMHANQLVILPNPIGAGAAALDINEHGVIVGTVGGSDAASLVK